MKHDSMDEMWAMLELMMAIDEMESFLKRNDLKEESLSLSASVEFDENVWKEGLVENWKDENND
jgi:Trp operon repressor